MTDDVSTGRRRGRTRAALLTAAALTLGFCAAPPAAAHSGGADLLSPAKAGRYTALGGPTPAGVGYLAVGTSFTALLEHLRADGRSPARVKLYDPAGRRLDATGRPVSTADPAAVVDGVSGRLRGAAKRLQQRGCTAAEVSVLVPPAASAERTTARAAQVLASLEVHVGPGWAGPVAPGRVTTPAPGAPDTTALRDCLTRLNDSTGHHRGGYLHNVWHRITGT